MMKRRNMRAMSILLAGAMLFGMNPAAVLAEETETQTLRVEPYMLTESFDPYVTDMDNIVTVQLYDFLFQRDADGNVAPCLAESWEESEDGMSLTVHLRQDVTFSDGTPFNADAVLYNYDLAVNSALVSSYFYIVDSMEKTDDYTVVIHKTAPYTELESLFVENMPIVSPTAYEKGTDEFGTNPVGTGAYTLENYDASTDYIYLTAREDYFQGTPEIKNIQIVTPLDSAASLVALENGEIDLNENPMNESDLTLAEADGLAVERSTGWSMKTVFLTGEPYNSDQNLRLAICYAINRDNAVIISEEQGAEAATQMFAQKLMGDYSGNTALYGYDTEKAAEYLAQSDYDGETLEINITSEAANVATSIQADLMAVGIQAEINQLDANSYSELFEKGNVGITILDNGVAAYGVEDTLSSFCADGYYVSAGLITSTDEMDALMQTIMTTTSAEERSSSMGEFLDLFQEHCSLIPLYEPELTYAHSADLEGAESIWGATTLMYLWKLSFK